MNNVVISLKKFLSNKNVVTVVGVIAIIIIIYFSYNYQFKKATNPVQIPVAKQEIPANTLITKDMIKIISVPSSAISSNVIRSKGLVEGNYSNVNSVIPAGSMFFNGTVVKPADRKDVKLSKLSTGEKLAVIKVNMDTTYGNSIINDSYIDIYMKAVDDSGEIMIGKFLENVKVISVEDASGVDVNSSSENRLTPSNLYFGASDDIFILLEKAKKLSSKSVELFPVLHGAVASSEALNMKVSTQYLRDFINAHTVMLDETANETVVDDNVIG